MSLKPVAGPGGVSEGAWTSPPPGFETARTARVVERALRGGIVGERALQVGVEGERERREHARDARRHHHAEEGRGERGDVRRLRGEQVVHEEVPVRGGGGGGGGGGGVL